MVPLVACLPLPICLGRLVSALCLGIRHLPYGLQVSALWLLSWEAFPSQHYHKDCPQKVLVQPSPAPYHLTTVRQSFTSGMLRGGQRYYCTWLAALTLEPDDLRSNPSSTTSCVMQPSHQTLWFAFEPYFLWDYPQAAPDWSRGLGPDQRKANQSPFLGVYSSLEPVL